MSNRLAGCLCFFVLVTACDGETPPGPAAQRYRPENDESLLRSACKQAGFAIVKELRDAEVVAAATVPDPAQKQSRQAALKARGEHIDWYFVEHCLKLPPAGKQCIDDIQHQMTALAEQRSELLLCSGDLQRGEVKQPADVERCKGEARERARQRIGECGAVVEQLLVAVDVEAANAAKK